MPAIATMPPFGPSPKPIPPHDLDNLRSELRKSATRPTIPRIYSSHHPSAYSHQGYSSARPAGRAHWKGRNQGGGWDAEAEFSAGAVGKLLCLVQVKQYATLTVQQRQVDELRGSCLQGGGAAGPAGDAVHILAGSAAGGG